ncbi:hypothetical protein SteCoe_18900 [Stentor coeruleus]|uniref:Uncharacterized protein n=1 Tax=Stentor coeruleus TaxID=5963 RepID=A0A1R2BVD9_9CILI|nr:hypothetical protein SteCoe_18900 [Stentor coeruleus]
MFHKSQTAIKNYSSSLNYNRITTKLSTKISSRRNRATSKSPPNTKKLFTPRVNSSFTITNEIYSPQWRLRSPSIDKKHKTASFDYNGARKGHHPLQSFQKFDEKVLMFINLGRQEIQKGKYLEAASNFSKALEIDPKCLDALYNKGLTNMLMNLYKEATIDFLNVLRENILYNKELYLKLSICFYNMKDLTTALRYISQGLHRFPKYYEGYLFRGQLYNELKQWEKAMNDFKKVLNNGKNDGNSLLGMAESLEGAGDMDSAIKMLDQGCLCSDVAMVALLKKAIIKGKIKDFSCVDDFDKYLERMPNCPKGLFYKAEVLYESKQFVEAALCYEQCIKYDMNYEYTPRSIFHLGAIKISEKDFYGALHTFERVGKHEIKEQKILQQYAETVINLMKRKYKEGITSFNKLLKRQDPLLKEYTGFCYMYCGYGYNALNLHEKAIHSFKKASLHDKLNKASLYNLELSYGLLSLSKGNTAQCLIHLEKCLKIFPRKAEPHIYHSAIILAEALAIDDIRGMQESEELLNTAMKMKEVDSEMLFFRSCIRYLMLNFEDATEDIKQSIEKAEDNIAEHYVLRGLCYAAERMYSEAVQDFTIALQLKESLDYVYWYRSRAGYLMDDTNIAFTDLQKYMLSRPSDHEVHFQASVLLIMGGSYDDALKALTNSISIKPTAKAAYLKAKCYVIMNEISSALEELNFFKEPSSGPVVDKEILKFLESSDYRNWAKEDFLRAVAECSKWTKCETGEIFEIKHILWLRGVYFMYSKSFSDALTDFQKVLELLHSKDTVAMSADEALTTEEENCEVLYNIALCHTVNKKSQSLAILSDLAEILNSKHRGQMLLLSSIIHLSQNSNSSAEKLLKEAFHCDPDSVTPFLSKKPTTILPLNTLNPFAQKFPLLNLDLLSDPIIQIRPAISLPRSALPNIEFSTEKEVREFFLVSKITPRPEAPWLNRVRGSIQFTNTLMDIDEPSQISEREQEEKKEIENSSNEIKRVVKSAVPLRHNSSFGKSEKNLNKQDDIKEAQAPEHIMDKIRDFCNKGMLE